MAGQCVACAKHSRSSTGYMAIRDLYEQGESVNCQPVEAAYWEGYVYRGQVFHSIPADAFNITCTRCRSPSTDFCVRSLLDAMIAAEPPAACTWASVFQDTCKAASSAPARVKSYFPVLLTCASYWIGAADSLQLSLEALCQSTASFNKHLPLYRLQHHRGAGQKQ